VVRDPATEIGAVMAEAGTPPVMQVWSYTASAPGQPENEDQILRYGDLVGVLDGATAPEGFDTGCVHRPAWYVRRLAARIGVAAADRPAADLTEILATAIRAVRGDHGDGCDMDHPGTPSATVCLLRCLGGHLDYLVLCDSPLVLDVDGTVGVVADDRLAHTMAGLRSEADGYRQAVWWQRRHMNRPDGYWVAAADPAAAYRALVGIVPLAGPGRVRRAALLSDGAARAVDQFGLLDWSGLLDLVAEQGPAELVRQVRAAEYAAGAPAALERRRRPRYKRHDDATAVLCQFDP